MQNLQGYIQTRDMKFRWSRDRDFTESYLRVCKNDEHGFMGKR